MVVAELARLDVPTTIVGEDDILDLALLSAV
jgi:hypothetical protein